MKVRLFSSILILLFAQTASAQKVSGPEPMTKIAWERAQYEMAQKFPQWTQKIYHVKKPKQIAWRFGPWMEDGEMVVGTQDKGQIEIAITDSWQDILDSIIHEYKHFIVYKLKLKGPDEMVATWWIDLVESDWRTTGYVYEGQ